MATLPSRFRTNIRATRRKLSDAHEVQFGLHQDSSEFDSALETLYANHESRWKAKGQGGVFADARRRSFYSLLTKNLHADDALRFFYLKLDGRIVAQEYCFAYGRTVFLLQEGFDYSLAPLNIGNALRSYVFEYLIAQGYEAYDFLAGMSRHKQTWSDSALNDITFEVCRPSLSGHLAHRLPGTIDALKNWLRPFRDRLRTMAQHGANEHVAP